GTGGLTRVVDKRKVRRDHADFFCTVTEGVRGQRAVDWKLVDELAPRSKLAEAAQARAEAMAAESDRPADALGITLHPLNRTFGDNGVTYDLVNVVIDRDKGVADILVQGPAEAPPEDAEGVFTQGHRFWPLDMGRQLEDAILHLRANETDISTWVFRTAGDADLVEAYDALLAMHSDDWLVREITLFLKRTFKRLDVTSRSLVALIEPGSCFTGTLLELALAADRSYMLDGVFEGSNLPEATLRPTGMNFGPYPMPNGLTRLESRFLDDPAAVAAVQGQVSHDLDAAQADELGLVTFIPDDIDWEDEVRLGIEERSSFSPDAMTGMEANLRFGGPETLETKIFGRLSAWQNWIFQRPNAVGEKGALKLFGTGQQAEFDRNRV
ncbi:MAG: benzoyl-CoA-dihydrodiol lyase, partial [Rhodobacterales bacterium]|nr:benzoyl-CoA-dihydrodiol lyase [Rhodobacterales bacterium]